MDIWGRSRRAGGRIGRSCCEYPQLQSALVFAEALEDGGAERDGAGFGRVSLECDG